MNQIHALCDKIIELKTGSYTDHIKDDYESIIKHMANKGCRSDVMSKVEDLYDLSNHAAKLARALKKYRSGINAIGDYVDLHWNRKNQNDVQYINAIEVKIDELEKEIEEIFK